MTLANASDGGFQEGLKTETKTKSQIKRQSLMRRKVSCLLLPSNVKRDSDDTTLGAVAANIHSRMCILFLNTPHNQKLVEALILAG